MSLPPATDPRYAPRMADERAPDDEASSTQKFDPADVSSEVCPDEEETSDVPFRDLEHVNDVVLRAFEALIWRAEAVKHGNHERSLAGIPTGFRQLDSCTSGLEPGSLIVVAGRPGSG